MTATNMTRFGELAWVRMAKSGELRSLEHNDYQRRLRQLAQSIEADERAAS